MEKLKILSADEQKRVSHITRTVNDFLSKKAMLEKKKQDETNKSTLGGVNFFYKFNKRDDGWVESVVLCWDVHPKDWDEELILNDIKMKIIDIEKQLYINNVEQGNEAFGSKPFSFY